MVPAALYGAVSLCVLCHVLFHLDVQNKNVPCAQLLQFLQRNIVIAAASVAGVLVVTVLLLLALTTCIRRKQLL